MDRDTLPYLIPYFISLVIAGSVGVYAWRHRDAVGATPFTLVTASQALWTLGYILELMSPTLEGKIFWDNAQFLGNAGWAIGFFALANEYSGHKFRHSRLVWGTNLSVIAIYLLLVLTDDYHRLIRPEARLVPGEPFTALTYPFTPSTWLVFLYMLGMLAFGFSVLITKFIRSHPLYRSQIILIIVGALVPLVGMTLTILGITLTFQRDTSPLTFALSNVIIVWGLFRYRLFDLAPIARDVVMDHIGESVFVLDARNRVVDLNPAAQKTLGRDASEVIGQPASALFPPHIMEQFIHVTEAQAEIVVEGRAGQRHFEVVISPLRDRRGGMVGRAIIAHDITRLKQAEAALRRHQDQLEALVEARTRALSEANAQLQREIAERRQVEQALATSEERYRLISTVAADYMFSTQLGPDGELHLNWVAGAFEPITGYTFEEYVAHGGWLAALHPDDAEQDARDMTALRANRRVITEVRTIHKDGGVRWVRVYAHPVWDAARHQLVGIYGAVQDITARKQAELSLEESEKALRALLDAATDPVFLLATDGTFLALNEALAKDMGRTVEVLIGAYAYDLLPPDLAQQRKAQIDEVIRTGKPVRFEDHNVGWYDNSIFPVFDAQGQVTRLAIYARDITGYKQAEAALQRYALRTEILHEIDRAILAARSPEEIVEAATSRMRRLVPCWRASVTVFDFQAGQVIALAGSFNGETSSTQAGARLPIGETFDVVDLAILRQGQPFRIDDLAAIPGLLAVGRQLLGEGVRSVVCLPLLSRDELIGALNLEALSPGAFSDEHIEIACEVADQLAIAMQQARLLAETTEALAREQRLSEVAHAISGTLDLQTIMPNVVRLAVELVGTTAGSLALVSPDGETLTFPYTFNLPEELNRPPAPKGEGVAWQIVETGQPLLLDDYAAHPNALPDWIKAGVHAVIGVPIIAGETRLGTLGLFSMDPARRLSKRDLALAESVGRQAGVAIQNARLFEAEQRRVALLTALHETDLDISAQLNLPALLQTIVQRAARLIEAPMGTFYLLQPDQTLELVVNHNVPGIAPGVRLQMDEGLSGKVARTGETMIIADYSQWPERAAVYEGLPLRAILAVPVKWQGRVLGVINVLDERPGRFGLGEAGAVSLLAVQAAVAIQNARLFEAERAARARADALVEAARVLSSILSLEDVLQRILAECARVAPFVTGAIVVYQDDVPSTVALAGYDGPLASLAPIVRERIREAPLLRQVALRQEPIIIADVDQEPAWVKFPNVEHIRSWIGVPLRMHDRAVGTLMLDSDRVGAYTPGHVAGIQALAAQAAIAIENAQLFEAETRLLEETRHRVQELEGLREIAQAFGALTDVRETLGIVVERIARLIGAQYCVVMLRGSDGYLRAQAPAYGVGDDVVAALSFPAQGIEQMPDYRDYLGQGFYLAGSAAEVPAFAREIAQRYGVETVLIAPMRIKGEVIGHVVVVDKPGGFTADDVRLLGVFAGQAAVVIQNARLFEQVRAGREQLQALSHRLVEVQEEERRHIARELHDEIGQTLTGLKLVLQVIPRLPPEAVGGKLKDALQLVNELMERAHDLSLDLRPAMLDDLGLPAALIWLFERYQAQTGVQVKFEFARLEERLAPEVETTAYRIVQEALTNVARHAQVKEAAVWLLADENALRIQVQDEGPGFDVPAVLAAGQRAGVVSMKERAALLGGWLRVESTPGTGTQVIASLPLHGRLERRKHDRLNSVGR